MNRSQLGMGHRTGAGGGNGSGYGMDPRNPVTTGRCPHTSSGSGCFEGCGVFPATDSRLIGYGNGRTANHNGFGGGSGGSRKDLP